MNDKKVNFIVNKAIAVDNLEVNFRGNIPLKSDYLINKTSRFNDNCYIEYIPTGSKMFQVIGNLYINDRLIGELRFSPRKGFFDSDLINFKFANILLYSDDFKQFKEYFINVLGFEYICISHIDVVSYSIGTNIRYFTADYYHKSDPENPISKQYQTRHKGKIKRKHIECSTDIHWGKMTADKSIKIYSKTLELIEQSPEKKSYLEYFWKLNGLPYENNTVESFELSLRHYHSKMLDFDKLTDTNYLASILQTHCKNFFDFEKEYRNHDKTYYKDVTPISFKGYDTVKIDKYRPEKQYSLKSEHTLIKTLYMEYLEAKFISSDIFVKKGLIQVPDRLKDYPTIMFAIDSLLAKYPSLNKDFQSKKSGYEKEFGRTNDLFNNRISIENHVKAIKINDGILFTTPDFTDPRFDNQFYNSLTPEQWKEIQLIEYRLMTFTNLLETFELSTMEKGDTLKKINKAAKTNVEKNFKQGKILREIDKNNSAIKTDTDMFEMNDRIDDNVFYNISEESVTPAIVADHEVIMQPAQKPDSIIEEKNSIQLEKNLEGKITEKNILTIYDTYLKYLTLEPKNKTLTFNQFFKVVIFCTICESKSYELSKINKFIMDNDSEMYASAMNTLIKQIIKDDLDVNGDIQRTK